jgi:predicted ATPase
MIKTIRIRNYKSIRELDLPLGRITVLIGENGAGKSNILESTAFAAAALRHRLEKEYLSAHGVRVTAPLFMKSAFLKRENKLPIRIEVDEQFDEAAEESHTYEFQIQSEDPVYSKWNVLTNHRVGNADWFATTLLNTIKGLVEQTKQLEDKSKAKKQLGDLKDAVNTFAKALADAAATTSKSEIKLGGTDSEQLRTLVTGLELQIAEVSSLRDFAIYSPEETALRKFDEEAQIEPLGIHGEGVLKLLAVTAATSRTKKLGELSRYLQLFAWFDEVSLPPLDDLVEKHISVKDRYIARSLPRIDEQSVNEGFLFLLFYFLLLISDRTPKFFAIDNVDSSLNPKLCEKLATQLTQLAKAHDKQFICTTHNPAFLDGLNLDDEDQVLYALRRDNRGATVVTRIRKPQTVRGASPMRLSEAFLKGLIGGVPKAF